MDVTITGRKITISDDVREQVAARLKSVEKLRDRIIRVEVEFSLNNQKGTPDDMIDSQITLRSRGPVVRAEACASDKMVAFDKALDKLMAQLRRAADRRKSRRGLRPMPQALPDVVAPEAKDDEIPVKNISGIEVTGDGPLVVREKTFSSEPLTLAQALDEMELVGHDFFLYVDRDTSLPSVVYRRRAYDYGVIHLETPKQ